MYTEKDLQTAAGIIKRIDHANHVPEAKVRADMETAMNAGRCNPDPMVQVFWKTLPFAGSKPTVEEFILWAATMAEVCKEQ